MTLFFFEEQAKFVSKNYVFGFAGMCFIFEVLAPVMIITSVSFLVLKYSFMVVLLMISVVSLIVCKPEPGKIFWRKSGLGRDLEAKANDGKNAQLIWVGALIVIGIQVVLVTAFRHIDTDDARFVAEAVEAIERNTMLKYHPITGRFFDYPIGETFKDVVSPFPMFIAVISAMLNLAPAITAHTVLPGIFVVVSYLVFYIIGMYFLEDIGKTGTYMFFLALIVMFSFESIYSYGYTLLAVIWQGRSFMCMIMIPLFSYCLISSLEIEKLTPKHYLLVVLMLLANIMASGMGIVLTGMILGAYALTRGILHKSFKCAVYAALPVIVNVVMLVLMKWCQANCWR